MSISASEETFQGTTGPSAWLYLDEVTHRTLNDYAAMLSMIRRASSVIPDGRGAEVLNAVATRLQAGAAMYDALRPQAYSRVRHLDDDLERVCASLTCAILSDRGIRLTLACERVCLSAQLCWQISLIICELVTNAVKHAFRGRSDGDITINARVAEGHLHCMVSDNGRALSDASPGRGTNIVDALARELGGSIVRHFSANGATIVLRVPLVQPAEAWCPEGLGQVVYG